MEIFFLTILKDRKFEIKVSAGRAMLPLNPVGKKPSLSCASFWYFICSPWHSLACSYIASISALVITAISPSVLSGLDFISSYGALVLLDKGPS
jgi:hypothetical protein